MKTWTERNLESGVTTVRIAGDLSRSTRTTISSAIGKAAGECPTAVLVDLGAMRWSRSTPLSLFAAVAYRAQESWGEPVLLYAADPEIHHNLGVFRSFVAIYQDQWQALTALRAYTPRWLRQTLSPAPDSVAVARSLLGEACLAWSLPHLRDTARLISSELAANAVQHAGTDFTVAVGYTRRYLRIAVQDRCRAMPHTVYLPPPDSPLLPPGSGRGLHVVEAFSTHWGATRVPGGKIVWALVGTDVQVG